MVLDDQGEGFLPGWRLITGQISPNQFTSVMTDPLPKHLPVLRGRTLRIYAALIFMQLMLHLYYSLHSRDPLLLPPHLVAWLHDVLLLSLVLGLSKLCTRFLPDDKHPVGDTVAGVVLLCSGMLLSLYPQMLREYLSFPVNLFEGNSSSALILVREYLGFDRLLPAGVAVCAVLLVQLIPVVPGNFSWLSRISVAVLVILTLAGLMSLPRSPHPVISSLKEEFSMRLTNASRSVPSLLPAPRRTAQSSEISQKSKIIGKTNAVHLYLMVLEGITSDDFEQNFLQGRHSGFYRRIAGNSVYFRNYYTTNLDSYTSLIAMLTSNQVPYRSYTDTGLYDAVNETTNLVRDFRLSGYQTLFVSTYDYQPFIPVRKDWNSIMHRVDLPLHGDWVSVESGRMESATEDRAAIPNVLSETKRYPKTFIMQELVYGHTTAWRAKTRWSSLAYYDRFFNDLLDRLAGEGEWSQSLMVIVADHGSRTDAAKKSNYRVPLLVAGPNVSPGTDRIMRSHLDLRGIIGSFMTGSPLPPAREHVLVVGSTERWVYGMIGTDGSDLFIDNKSGRILAKHGNLDPRTLHMNFQNMIDAFGERFGPRAR